MLQGNIKSLSFTQEGHPSGTCAEETPSFPSLSGMFWPFPPGSGCLAPRSVPMIGQHLALDGLEAVPSPASLRTCFCLQLPTLPRGQPLLKTAVKVLENYSALKNTSENGYIINGPAVSTVKPPQQQGEAFL